MLIVEALEFLEHGLEHALGVMHLHGLTLSPGLAGLGGARRGGLLGGLLVYAKGVPCLADSLLQKGQHVQIFVLLGVATVNDRHVDRFCAVIAILSLFLDHVL